ncbi:TSUP family transporter [Streptomyces sp. NPDC051940]|uniref:sulfite exporter TauE/SafE family protein n=1 Tax=Streptomyces sp. NPDC051940 TaxID=3155675 RepID=UPI00341260E1
MDAVDVCALLAVALAAGWLDAVVGGGGLIQIPGLMLLVPGAPVATVLGTNKLVAITGTSSAALTYTRRVGLDRGVVLPAALVGVPGSALGAMTASYVPERLFLPAVLVALLGVAGWVTLSPAARGDVRTGAAPRSSTVVGCAAGAGIGFYSGILGSGTGVLLVVLFVAGLGSDFLRGSAMAKVVSVGTDLGALALFATYGHVLWEAGAAMAAANVTGGVLGARTALCRGAGFVRGTLLCVVAALVAKLSWDMWAA